MSALVRVQPKEIRDILVDQVMESQYQPFESSESTSDHGEHKFTTQTGVKKIVFYVLYGILVLLLLILLMVTGIKFDLFNKEITNIRQHIERISSGFPVSSSSSSSVPQVTFPRLVPVRGTCRVGWVSFQSSCYFLSTSALTWSKAENWCRAQGAHLLVLNNVGELDYISKIVELQNSYWIGLVERQHEGHWSWVDGTNFNSTQTFWDKGQPDNWDYRENGEDCGQLHPSEIRKRKLWNDADCGLPYHYICETRA